MVELHIRKLVLECNGRTREIKKEPIIPGINSALKFISKNQRCYISNLVVEENHEPIWSIEDVEAKKGIYMALLYLNGKLGKDYRQKLRMDFVIWEDGIRTWAKSIREKARKFLLKH